MTAATPPSPKTMELLAKLKALAENDGATENEAAVAMQKMQKILFDHNLSMADIDMSAKDKQNPESKIGEKYRDALIRQNRKPGSGFKQRSSMLQPYEREWRVRLAGAVARFNFCGIMTTKTFGSVWFVGTSANVEAVETIWAWACEQIDRLSYEALAARRKNSLQKALEGHQSGRKWREDWLFGCVDRVSTRLWESWKELQKQNEQSKALVIHNGAALAEYLAERATGPASVYKQRSHGAGYNHGYAAGDRVDLNRPAARIEGAH